MAVARLGKIAGLHIRSLINGTSVDRERDEELRGHVERQVDVNVEGVGERDVIVATVFFVDGSQPDRDYRHHRWVRAGAAGWPHQSLEAVLAPWP